MVEHIVFDVRHPPSFEPDDAVKMAECAPGHPYHYKCIIKWLEKHDSCPQCLRGTIMTPHIPAKPIDVPAQYDNSYYLAKAVNSHVYKLAIQLRAPAVFTDGDIVEYVASRIFARERWFFHPGGTAFVMRREVFDVNYIIECMRGGEVKFAADYSGVTVYPVDFCLSSPQ
jgi:hypothetical protein